MISTKGRYALRVMIDIAQHEKEGYIKLEDIAERQEISKKYLEIIIKQLVTGKLVKGLRGKGGGYILTKAASEYSVWEILKTAEGSMAVVSCLEDGAEPCERRNVCTTLSMWERYDIMVKNFFEGISLQDLVYENLLVCKCSDSCGQM